MNEFLQMLHEHISIVEQICEKIEDHRPYQEELRGYLVPLQQLIQIILGFANNSLVSVAVNEEFVVQVLNDIIYGIEHEDDVFLLDVLRYGLLEIYYYIDEEWQGEDRYE